MGPVRHRLAAEVRRTDVDAVHRVHHHVVGDVDLPDVHDRHPRFAVRRATLVFGPTGQPITPPLRRGVMTIDQPDLDDLREMLDASFGDGPALPAPLDRLAAGHRSLRRRRRAGVAGSAVVAVVVVASFAVLGPGGTGPQGADPVSPAPSLAPPSASTAQDEARKAGSSTFAVPRSARPARRTTGQDGVSWSAHAVHPPRYDVVDGEPGCPRTAEGDRAGRRAGSATSAPEDVAGRACVTDGGHASAAMLRHRSAPRPVAPGATRGRRRQGLTAAFEDWLASMVALHQAGPARRPAGQRSARRRPAS